MTSKSSKDILVPSRKKIVSQSKFLFHFSALKSPPASLAVSRLQAIITTFLLRRMKDSLLDGKRLIELPDKTVSLVKLEFSAEEREIYTMVVLNTL